MGGKFLIVAVVFVLLLSLGGVALASYGGFTSSNIGTGGPSVRSSSLHGPAVIGGGPGHGK